MWWDTIARGMGSPRPRFEEYHAELQPSSTEENSSPGEDWDDEEEWNPLPPNWE